MNETLLKMAAEQLHRAIETDPLAEQILKVLLLLNGSTSLVSSQDYGDGVTAQDIDRSLAQVYLPLHLLFEASNEDIVFATQMLSIFRLRVSLCPHHKHNYITCFEHDLSDCFQIRMYFPMHSAD